MIKSNFKENVLNLYCTLVDNFVILGLIPQYGAGITLAPFYFTEENQCRKFKLKKSL